MRDRIPALDGLRAVACFAVVAYHTAFPGAGGGWLGVDVFFVLSGYLITGLLLAEIDETGRIRLGAFWIRRAARLYPALLVLVVALAVPWVSMRSDDGTLIPAIAAVTYTSDLVVGLRIHALGAYGHTWSLAVEEQFYLLWPLVVLALRTRRRIAAVATVGAFASLALMVTTSQEIVVNQHAFYFLPHTRVWELLAGCLLACLPAATGRTARAATWIGLACAAAAWALVHQFWHSGLALEWQAPIMLTTVAASALLVAGLSGAVTVPSRVLSLAPMVWLGRRSYGIYLFQTAGGALYAHLHVEPVLRFPLMAGGATVLAAASYRFVETPTKQWAARALARPRRVVLPVEAGEGSGLRARRSITWLSSGVSDCRSTRR